MLPNLLPPEPEPPVNRRREAALAFIAPAVTTVLTATGFGLYFAEPEGMPSWVFVVVLALAGAGCLAVIVTTCIGEAKRIPLAALVSIGLMLAAQFTLVLTVEKAVLAARGVEVACVVVDRRDYTSSDRGADRELTWHQLECEDWPSFEEVTDRDDQLAREVTATFDPTGAATPSVGGVDLLRVVVASLAPAGLIAASLLVRRYSIYRGRRGAR